MEPSRRFRAHLLRGRQPIYRSAVLRQPFQEALAPARSILLAGCGGGYDVLGAIPLLLDLVAQGKTVHLASLSFCYLDGLAGAERQPDVPNLFRVTRAAATERAYCPEAWLASWLSTELKVESSVWAFDKTGVVQLEHAYRHLIARLGIDALVLIDGGIDAVLRGDESSLGTPSEDLASLAAVRDIDVPVKLLACVALGAEIRDGICHAQVFDRIAELSRSGGYLGAAPLIAGTPTTDRYVAAVDHVFSNQEGQRQSHIHRMVLRALRGESGPDGPHIWVSPLLPMFWFFALDRVAESHLFLRDLEGTRSIWEVVARIEAARERIAIRDRSVIPI